jgi:hypothetical protein
MTPMISEQADRGVVQSGAGGVRARSTVRFAAIGDHVRLPWRFFARLFASDGSLLAR